MTLNSQHTTVKLIECPRDAWQGLEQLIPTEEKMAYHRRLLTAGFRHIDAVSFVSPKHVKQMADSEDVMHGLLESGALKTAPEVIGIVANAKLMSIREEPTPMLYVPVNAFYTPNTNLLVRTERNARAAIPAITAIAQGLDRNVPLFRIRTLEDQLALSLGQERMIAGLLSAFASLALILAAVGLYGVISYTTQIRTREFGVRLALGALPADVLRLVLGQGARLTLVGLAIGLAVAAGTSRVLASLLFGVGGTDAATYLAIAGVLLAATTAAAAIPARRAARVNPMATLRDE